MNFQQQLSQIIETSGAPGASFAYWDGATLHTAVAGKRNSVTGDPVTQDTLMHIGSISKLLNTVLMMQLVDDGLIRLEDPVIKHLPQLRLRDMTALSKITCAMLVNHTSGIDGMLLPDHGPDRERIADAIERFAELGQLHEPGGGPSYCNAATVIAGYLAQTLRGESWYTLIKQRIYEPLEMRHALADISDLPRFRHSVGDVTDPATGKLVQTTRPFLPLSFAPAGATLMMSATDLVSFARALLNGGAGLNGARILSAESTARMTQPTADIVLPVGWRWGLGWMLLPGELLFHSGSGPGVAAFLYAQPQTGRVAVLLTNCDRKDAVYPAMLEPIIESWTGLRPHKPQPSSAPLDPAPYLGVFENVMVRGEIVAHGKGIGMRMGWKARVYDNSQATTPVLPLVSLSEHQFDTPYIPGIVQIGAIRFVNPDASGRMGALGFNVHLLMRSA
ncbi:MAG: serine hydrolase domain-containing protein [Nevskiales bacterium]